MEAIHSMYTHALTDSEASPCSSPESCVILNDSLSSEGNTSPVFMEGEIAKSTCTFYGLSFEMKYLKIAHRMMTFLIVVCDAMMD